MFHLNWKTLKTSKNTFNKLLETMQQRQQIHRKLLKLEHMSKTMQYKNIRGACLCILSDFEVPLAILEVQYLKM